MSEIIQRFIRADGLMPERGWRLIEWCAAQRGDEFSFQFMSLAGEPPALHQQIRSALAAFHNGTPKRDTLMAVASRQSRRPTETWSLGVESMAALRRQLSVSVFTPPSYSPTGWIENFTIYRRGEIMLEDVSHEGIVMLRFMEPEYQEFSKLEIESHETAAMLWRSAQRGESDNAS